MITTIRPLPKFRALSRCKRRRIPSGNWVPWQAAYVRSLLCDETRISLYGDPRKSFGRERDKALANSLLLNSNSDPKDTIRHLVELGIGRVHNVRYGFPYHVCRCMYCICRDLDFSARESAIRSAKAFLLMGITADCILHPYLSSNVTNTLQS